MQYAGGNPWSCQLKPWFNKSPVRTQGKTIQHLEHSKNRNWLMIFLPQCCSVFPSTDGRDCFHQGREWFLAHHLSSHARNSRKKKRTIFVEYTFNTPWSNAHTLIQLESPPSTIIYSSRKLPIRCQVCQALGLGFCLHWPGSQHWKWSCWRSHPSALDTLQLLGLIKLHM